MSPSPKKNSATTNLLFYINGQWCKPQTSTQVLPVINPATQSAFANVCLANNMDVDAAVDSAAKAFDRWSQTTLQ